MKSIRLFASILAILTFVTLGLSSCSKEDDKNPKVDYSNTVWGGSTTVRVQNSEGALVEHAMMITVKFESPADRCEVTTGIPDINTESSTTYSVKWNDSSFSLLFGAVESYKGTITGDSMFLQAVSSTSFGAQYNLAKAKQQN